MGEATAFPILLGLFDPLLAGRNEIPPDVTRAFQRIAAEEHHPGRLQGLHGDAVTGAEDQQSRPLVALACDFDLTIDHIDRALLMIGVERQDGACFGSHLGVEPWRYHRDRWS